MNGQIGGHHSVALTDAYTKGQADDSFAPISRSRRNLLINGCFRVWQRGTYIVPTGVETCADMWRVRGSNATGGTVNVIEGGHADVQLDRKSYMAIQVTGLTDYIYTYQHIEGVETSHGKTVTLSGLAHPDVNHQIDVYLKQRFGTGGSPSADVFTATKTASLTGGQDGGFELSFDLPSISGKTVGTDGNDSLQVFIFIRDENGNDVPADGVYRFAEFKLEEGESATDFEYRPVAEERALCKRYFQTTDDSFHHIWSGSMVSGRTYYLPVNFAVEMRDSPALVVTPEGTNGFNNIVGSSYISRYGFYTNEDATTTGDSGYFRFSYTANAEI